jgi:hypothetical protein
VPRNGEINEKFGSYKSVCCGAEIVINSGARFPYCPRHLNLSTIWKSSAEDNVPVEAANRQEFVLEVHVDNRRLFDIAAGALSPDSWEREHFHKCNVCQSVLDVFLRQPITRSPNSEKPRDAA